MNSRRAHSVPLSYPLLLWATEIAIIDVPDDVGDRLRVYGKPPVVSTAEDKRAAIVWDVWHQSLRPERNSEPTHMMFVNARNDHELRSFVERFGPVVAVSYEEEDNMRLAEQLWSDLQREHAIYHAAHAAWELIDGTKPLTSPPKRLRDLVKVIVDGVSHWPVQHKREVYLRASKQIAPPKWNFTDSNLTWLRDKLRELEILCGPRKGDRLPRFVEVPNSASAIGQLVLCELVNAFPTEVTLWGDRVAELPASDMLFGVRPALYAILRRELMGTRGIRFCKDETCARLFEMTHGRQEYCPDRNCEQHHRQRKYWTSKGSATRRARLAKKIVGLHRRQRKTRRGDAEDIAAALTKGT